MRSAGTLILPLALGACSLAPHYVRPAAPVPPSWPTGDAYDPQDNRALPAVSYRDVFKDARLQQLITQALANNRDIRKAAADIAQARAQLRITRAAQLPQIDVSGSVEAAHNIPNASTYVLQGGVSGFELDLFGKLANATAAQRENLLATEAAADTVVLDFDDRHRRRMTMRGTRGLAFLLDLENAIALRGGDALVLEDGRLVEVVAAPEPLLEIKGHDPHHLIRVAWHLGNRHLPTQIMAKALRIRRDHVIEAMVKGLGARVIEIEAPFDPEGGAYAGAAHGHAHEADAHHHPAADEHAHDHGHHDHHDGHGHHEHHHGHSHAHDHDG